MKYYIGCESDYFVYRKAEDDGWDNDDDGFSHTGVNQTYAEFKNTQEAIDMLKGCEFVEQAIAEKWELVRFRLDSIPADGMILRNKLE